MNDVKEKKVVLIVEDNEKSLKLFRDILVINGFLTIEARDGKSGVEKARSEKPDLILLDIQLPVMDGIEAIKILKNTTTTEKIPTIAVTAYAMAKDKTMLMESGYDGIITKPIDVNSFVAEIKKYL